MDLIRYTFIVSTQQKTLKVKSRTTDSEKVFLTCQTHKGLILIFIKNFK